MLPRIFLPADQPVRKVRQHDLPSLEKGWGLRLLGGGGGGRGRVGVGGSASDALREALGGDGRAVGSTLAGSCGPC